MKKPVVLQTFKEFHALVPKIVKEITANPMLAQRALANPILAMEELGYELSETVQWEIERYIRYSRTSRKALADLEEEIEKLMGRKVDMRDETAVEKALFEDLRLKRPAAGIRISQIHPRDEAMRRLKKAVPEAADPLIEIADEHPIVKLIIKHRELTHKTAPLATREQYDELKSGARKLSVGKVAIRFKREPEQHEDTTYA